MMSETGVVQAAGWVKVLLIGILCGMALLAPTVAKRARAADFTISGAVTDQANKPIENIRVTVKRFLYYDNFERPVWGEVISGTTSLDGSYSLIVPSAGPFRIEFADSVSPRRYHSEFFDDKASLETSTDVLIAEGSLNAVANAQLTAIQPITGHVTDEGGNPLADIRVSTFHQVGDPKLEHLYWGAATGATTDASGAYTLTAPEDASFRIGFEDASSTPRYVTEYYENAGYPQQAINILFDKDHPVYVVDAQLAIGSVITGQIVDGIGTPVSLAAVFAGVPVADEAGQVFLQESRQTTSDSNGYYTLTLPLSGTVGVGIIDNIYPNRFNEQYYDHVPFPHQPTSVTVTIGEVTPNINLEVPFYGVISGQVTNKGGNPINKISVTAHRLVTDTFGNEFWFRFSQIEITDPEGRYELPVWTEESIRLCFKLLPYPGQIDFYIPRCYGSNSDNPANGSDLQVNMNSVLSDVNIQLGEFGKVVGFVRGINGEPLPNVSVAAHTVIQRPDGTLELADRFDQGGMTDVNGHYEFRLYELGTFVLMAYPIEPTPYTREYFDSQFDLSKAQVFTSEANLDINVDFQLSLKSNISGTVINQAGEPLVNVSVTVFRFGPNGFGGEGWMPFVSTTTDDSGVYTITQIDAGIYRVGFGLSQDYTPQFYPYTNTVETATDVVLGVGESAGNINGQLSPLYRVITGQVSDQTGDPLPGITVQLGHNEFGNWVFDGHETSTDVSGTYTLTALPTGTFNLGFFDSSGTFVTEYYDNADSPITALGFAIPSIAPFTDVNVEMKGKAHIQGSISGPNGEAVSNHSVVLYNENLNEVAQTQTITDGSYELFVLGGVYRLCVGTSTLATIYEPECYVDANPSNIAAATPFTVENGTENEINVQLAKKANPNGTITILLSSTPKSIRNLHFTSTVGDFALDDPTLDDGDAYSNTISFTLPSAIYPFTVVLPSDRFLQNISCEGPGMLEANDVSFQIALPAEATMTCTVQVALGAAVQTLSYHDANGDGMFNEGETPQAGITVTVHNAITGVDIEQVSGEDGSTQFVNLPPGAQFYVCQTPPQDWVNSQPGTINGLFNSPCYSNSLQAGQLATVRFGNIEANDPDFTNTPSTSPDGFVISDAPVVDDTDEEGEMQMNVYLPVVSR